MPLTDEQRETYLTGPNPRTLLGTWWYHLPWPGEPRLYIVANVEEVYAGGNTTHECQLQPLRWDGEAWNIGRGIRNWEPIRCFVNELVNPFTSFWLLGDGWLGVFLRPGQEVRENLGVGGIASVTQINDDGLTIRVHAPAGAGRTWWRLDLYEFNQMFHPVLAQTPADSVEVEPVAELPVAVPEIEPEPRSRFDRL